MEKNAQLGEETSSRNSEVIHAALYYPPDSLKTKLCLAGKKMLYQSARKFNIPHKQCGKWIIAQNQKDSEYLHALKKKGDILGIPLSFLSHDDIKKAEPNVQAIEALSSPTSGIIDSHSLLLHLSNIISTNGSDIALQTATKSIQRTSKGSYLIEADSGGEICQVETESLINCGGLHAHKVAEAGLGYLPDEYQTFFCKGHYFGYSGKPQVSRMIYPCPEPNLEGLGVHVTLDLSGRMRFGPDTLYISQNDDYSLQPSRALDFEKAIRRYLPSFDPSKLYPDYAGIRPKLSGPGQPARDFLIKEESSRGFPGFVNMLGIESPGLTASLAIAEMVADLLNYKGHWEEQ